MLNQLPAGVHIGKQTDVGRQREQNEDTIFVLDAELIHEYGNESVGLFVVADGMGGHQKGDIASSLAVRTCVNEILNEIYLPYLTQAQQAGSEPLADVLKQAVLKAGEKIIEEVPDGGTTLTLAVMLDTNAYIAHVGDTRVYLFKDNALTQITTDHSLAHRLQTLGTASSDEISQAQNVLYKAVGQKGLKASDVDTHLQFLRPGSSFVMCTDGLWNLVTDEAIIEILSSVATPQDACKRLVSAANDNGGPDNISIIIVSVGIDDELSLR